MTDSPKQPTPLSSTTKFFIEATTAVVVAEVALAAMAATGEITAVGVLAAGVVGGASSQLFVKRIKAND